MPVQTWAVASNADDVSQQFNVTNPGGAGDYVTGTYLHARAHQANQGIAAVQFVVSIPRGATLNSVRFSWVAVPADAISQDASEMVIGVENTFAPAAFGTSSPNRPSDRLTGRTTGGGVTYYDVTWQDSGGSAVANQAAVANNTRVYTQNIGPLLQPLVNSASWDSGSQKITIFCWGKDTGASVVQLQPTSTSNRNSSARWASAGTATPPQLTVDYVVVGPSYTLAGSSGGSTSSGLGGLLNRTGPILQSVTGRSKSSGRGLIQAVQPPNPVVLLRNQRYEDSIGGGWVIPGTAADGDTPVDNALSGNPLGWGANPLNTPTDTPAGGRVRNVSQPLAVSGRSLRIESYIDTGTYVGFRFDNHSPDHSAYTAPLSAYSARFYYRHDPLSGVYGYPGMFPQVIRFLNGPGTANVTWGLMLDDSNSILAGQDVESERLYLTQGSTNTVIAGPTARLLATAGIIWRYEIQVDEARSPKVRVRVYRNAETTPFATLTGSPTSVLADQIRLGISANQQVNMQHWADLEVHSNYDLSGEFQDPVLTDTGTPYVPKKWAWFEYSGPDQYEELEDLGTWTGSAVSGVPLTYEDDLREVAGVEYTSSPATPYGGGQFLTIHTPVGFDPPAGGWPVLMLVHGGFFIGGSRTDWLTTNQILRQAIALGWAVACPSYNLSSVNVLTPTTYPAWSTAGGTGRYPSHIVEIKKAAHFLKSSAISSTYSLNPARMVVGGFSAGGYIAMAAHVSRDVTADSQGRDLTIYGPDPWARASALQDPEFLGAYAWAGPVSMQAAVDSSEEVFWNTSQNTNIVSGAKAFMGRGQAQSYSLLGTGVDELLDAQASPEELGPIGYNGGSSDYLVKPWVQIPLLDTACDAAGVELDYSVSLNSSHDNMKKEFDPDHLARFLGQFGSTPLTGYGSNPISPFYSDFYSNTYESG